MFKNFYPYERVSNVFDIDYDKLYSLGYKAIIFDIDNTLVHHGEDSTPEIDYLFVYIHKIGLKTLLLSNNDAKRIERFLRNIDSPYIPDANKPKIDNYLKALKILNCKKEEVIFVGDQIFTDIYGANKCKIPNILVDFLRYETETKIGKKRMLEKIILRFYALNKTYRNRIGDISKERNYKNYVLEER